MISWDRRDEGSYQTQDVECHPDGGRADQPSQRSLRAYRSRGPANAPSSGVRTGSHKPSQGAVPSKRPRSGLDLRPKPLKRQKGQDVLVDQ